MAIEKIINYKFGTLTLLAPDGDIRNWILKDSIGRVEITPAEFDDLCLIILDINRKE